MLKRLLFVFLALFLEGCGFHLRGLNEMPTWLNSVAIVIQNAHRDLGPMLKNQLESYKICVVPDPTQAEYVLVIEADGIQQQLTSVAASTGPRQYLLIYDVQFSLTKTKGEVVIPSSHVFITRQLTVNSNKILGSNSEETQISYEMRRDAAMQIINRLGKKGKTLPAVITTPLPTKVNNAH